MYYLLETIRFNQKGGIILKLNGFVSSRRYQIVPLMVLKKFILPLSTIHLFLVSTIKEMLKSSRILLNRSSSSSSLYLNRRLSTLLTTKPIEKLTIEDLSHPSINQQDEIGRLKLIESIQNTSTLSTQNRNELLEF